MATTVGERLLTRREAAEYLGVAPQTLADWASRKGRTPRVLPMVRVGKFARYRMSDITAFVDANRSIPGSQVDPTATPHE